LGRKATFGFDNFKNMNRLVIIGNGFDLAHGLPTGYCDFVSSYWKNVVFSFWHARLNYDDNVISIKINPNFDSYAFNPVRQLGQGKELDKVNSYSSFMKFIESNSYAELDDCCQIDYKNDFFEVLNQIHSLQNWVDVENEYYKRLKYCLDLSDNTGIKKLNSEFAQVKKLLENYLKEKVENAFEFPENTQRLFTQILEDKDYYNGGDFETLQMELTKKTTKEIKEIKQRVGEFSVENYFLNFNYTSTMKKYMNLIGIDTERLNQIHGSLDDQNNPINFGFGDEMDKHYSEIEEKDDNEYLRNIKSFQYLDTANYKHLLDLIDSNIFQVYIMGHSCGLSDRTLLNTIFEHENCRSIKIYYHEKEDGTNNYNELTQNISRHFNKKKLMREKIVNKTRCQPMPQIKLPKKENGL
jgi:hypothetical protein